MALCNYFFMHKEYIFVGVPCYTACVNARKYQATSLTNQQIMRKGGKLIPNANCKA